jgi:uncharacterized protein YbcI
MRSEVGSDIDSRSQPEPRGAMLLAISNAIVRVHKQYFGKGPTRARAYYDGDVVTCVLHDVYTRAEQTLLENGRRASVLRQRDELQDAVRDLFIKEIEQITGRTVIGFFSGNQADPDLSVEVFVLASTDGTAG